MLESIFVFGIDVSESRNILFAQSTGTQQPTVVEGDDELR